MSFWDALPILQNGIAASVIVALLCSYLGVFVVLKRIVFMTAALSQVSSLGITISLPLQAWIWGSVTVAAGTQQAQSIYVAAVPVIVAILFACTAASIMAFQYSEKRLTRESLLGIAYVIPAALAMLVLDATGGTVHDINNLLFGNTVFVPATHLTFLIIVAIFVSIIHVVLYKEFIFISFDPDTAKALGIKTIFLTQILFYSLAMMISVSIITIGVLPVFSFMIIPATASLMITNTLKHAFLIATLFGVISAIVGYYLSFEFALPTGPTMVATASLLFIPGLFIKFMTGFSKS